MDRLFLRMLLRFFFKDYIILKMIGSDMQNPAFICFFVFQKSFSVFCKNFRNCRLQYVGFLAPITQMGFYYLVLFFKVLIKRIDSSESFYKSFKSIGRVAVEVDMRISRFSMETDFNFSIF